MNTTTMDNKHYKIDANIKYILMDRYGFGDKEAEGIALAIDMKEQDMSGVSTKGDLKEVRNELKGDINELKLQMQVFRRDIIIWVLTGTFVINQLPNIFNLLLKVTQ